MRRKGSSYNNLRYQIVELSGKTISKNYQSARILNGQLSKQNDRPNGKKRTHSHASESETERESERKKSQPQHANEKRSLPLVSIY